MRGYQNYEHDREWQDYQRFKKRVREGLKAKSYKYSRDERLRLEKERENKVFIAFMMGYWKT